MFCTKCGNNIPDGTKFCATCGTPVFEAPVVETPVAVSEASVVETPVALAATPAPAPVAAKVEKKKGKTGLIVGIIVAVLLLAGGGIGGFLFLNQPMRKINKAIEVSDTTTVVDLYDKLTKEENQELVKEEMLKVADKIYDDYTADELSYDDALDQLKPIGKEILKGNKDYDKIIANIETINDSRKNYEKAEKAFGEENYEDAYGYYQLVDSLDKKNYKKAQDQIEVCEELMVVPIEGEWRCVLNLGDQLVEEMGLYGSDYPIVFNVPILLTLDSDGNGTIEVDMVGMDDSLEEFLSSLDEVLYIYLEDVEGMSRDDIDMYLTLAGYNSISELVREFADVDELKESFEDATAYFTYTYDDGELYIIEDDSTIYVDVANDTLSFLGTDGYLTSTFDLEALGVDYDTLVFDKVN